MKKKTAKIICFGELMVDFTSLEPGKPLSRVSNFRKHPGGSPANVAMGLHFHGIPVMLWSKVGKDSLGEFLIDRLAARGLSTQGVRQDEKYPTKIALVEIDRHGERSFEFHNTDSAAGHIALQDLDLASLPAANLFHFSGVTLLSDITYRTTVRALRLARENRCLISFDPNIRIDRMKQPSKILERIGNVLPLIDFLKINAGDWPQFFPRRSPADIIKSGVLLLTLTGGTKGAWLITEGQKVFIPAREVKAVDTTGAGDAFTAALLSKLIAMPKGRQVRDLTGKQLLSWGKFAAGWSAEVVQQYGATTAYFED